MSIILMDIETKRTLNIILSHRIFGYDQLTDI